MDAELAAIIVSQVREQDIVQMAVDVVNIPSPTGEELEMGRYMRRAFEETGLRVAWQEVEPGRANVVGTWEGTGGGKSLMFNGHMDTSNSGKESFLTGIGYKPHAVIRDSMIFGLGIYNMKGALVCYTEAVRALQRAGLRPKGDVVIAAVVGEIEKTQWGDEHVGAQYRGYGAGTHYLVTHGATADMCILGEPTDMQLVLGHCGSLWLRLSTHGPYRHTAFTRGREAESSIHRMHHVLGAVYDWMPAWQKRRPMAASRALPTSAAYMGAFRGAPAARPNAPTPSSICACRRRCRWPKRGARWKLWPRISAAGSPTPGSNRKSTSPCRARKSPAIMNS